MWQWSIFLILHLFNNFFSSSATGFRVYLRLDCPSGRPRCDIRTTDLAPFSSAYFTESRAATMRWLLVITPSFNGTLKSTLKNLRSDFNSRQVGARNYYFSHRNTYLINTRLPVKFRASILSLLRAMINLLIYKLQAWKTDKNKVLEFNFVYHKFDLVMSKGSTGQTFLPYKKKKLFNHHRQTPLLTVQHSRRYKFKNIFILL